MCGSEENGILIANLVGEQWAIATAIFILTRPRYGKMFTDLLVYKAPFVRGRGATATATAISKMNTF